MTLENLLKLGRLHAHEPAAREIQSLLAAAHRNLRDAGVDAISAETRFDAAYKSLLQSALAVLMATGYRPSTSEPGHHATILQSLPKTIGLPAPRLIILDALRKKRNLADYTGMELDEPLMRECRDRVGHLALRDVTRALRSRRATAGERRCSLPRGSCRQDSHSSRPYGSRTPIFQRGRCPRHDVRCPNLGTDRPAV